MGAKKTSDLMPLCHPLPLDRVHVEIELVENRAIVHKALLTMKIRNFEEHILFPPNHLH
jgi:molybdenum cofactor biosynthesis enzyme